MAKSRSIGGIYASLSLRDGGFKKGLKSASKELKEFGSKALKGAAVGVAALATGMTAAAIIGTKSTLTMVDDLADVSAQTGVAVADMMRLQQAYKDGGREASAVGKDIGKMQKAIVMATDGGDDPFKELGLSAKYLLARSPAKQFELIGDAIMRIENPAKRTALAMRVFGKGGMGLTTVFDGVDDAVRSLGKMPEIAAKFAGAMGEANDLIGRLPVKSQQFFTGFTAGIIGELLPQLEKIDDYDFTDLGLSVGAALSTAFETIADGSVWEIFQLNAEKAILGIQNSDAMNGWAATINTIFDGITNNMGAGGFDFGESFDKYTQAGNEANAELIKQKEDRITELVKAAEDRFKEKQSAAEARTGNGSSPDAITIPQIIIPKIAPVKPLDAMSEVNDYQRRGLALSDGTRMAAKKADEQIAEAKETNKTLKQLLAVQPGELFW